VFLLGFFAHKKIGEAPRFIDIDPCGQIPYPELPRKLKNAADKFGEDSLQNYGLVPWHVQVMLGRNYCFNFPELKNILLKKEIMN
jgi:hypothetical protein